MFPTRKRIVHLHVNGKVIRTTADHFFHVEGEGTLVTCQEQRSKSKISITTSGAKTGTFRVHFGENKSS